MLCSAGFAYALLVLAYAQVVGFDEDKDIAVLQVDTSRGMRGGLPVSNGSGAPTLRPLPLGRSAPLQVGQRVYAIGAARQRAHAWVARVRQRDRGEL